MRTLVFQFFSQLFLTFPPAFSGILTSGVIVTVSIHLVFSVVDACESQAASKGSKNGLRNTSSDIELALTSSALQKSSPSDRIDSSERPSGSQRSNHSMRPLRDEATLSTDSSRGHSECFSLRIGRSSRYSRFAEESSGAARCKHDKRVVERHQRRNGIFIVDTSTSPTSNSKRWIIA